METLSSYLFYPFFFIYLTNENHVSWLGQIQDETGDEDTLPLTKELDFVLYGETATDK